MDQFEALLADSAKQPRDGHSIASMITGQPLRIKYLARALDEMKKHERVVCDPAEIIDRLPARQYGAEALVLCQPRLHLSPCFTSPPVGESTLPSLRSGRVRASGCSF